MIQRQEEETNRFSQSSEAVQWKFQRWKSHSNREVKEVTSGINIYWESITALLGVEATAVKWRGQKKWGNVAGTRGKKSGRGGWAGRVEGRTENTLKLQVRDGSAAIRLKLEWDTPVGSWVCESSVNYKVPPQELWEFKEITRRTSKRVARVWR